MISLRYGLCCVLALMLLLFIPMNYSLAGGGGGGGGYSGPTLSTMTWSIIGFPTSITLKNNPNNAILFPFEDKIRSVFENENGRYMQNIATSPYGSTSPAGIGFDQYAYVEFGVNGSEFCDYTPISPGYSQYSCNDCYNPTNQGSGNQIDGSDCVAECPFMISPTPVISSIGQVMWFQVNSQCHGANGSANSGVGAYAKGDQWYAAGDFPTNAFSMTANIGIDNIILTTCAGSSNPAVMYGCGPGFLQ